MDEKIEGQKREEQKIDSKKEDEKIRIKIEGIKKEEELEKKTSKKVKKKSNEIYVEKKLNSLGSIKFSHFRKFAYNGLIEPEYVEDIPILNIIEKKITKSWWFNASSCVVKSVRN